MSNNNHVALIIGVDKYDKLDNLPACKKDAEDIHNLFISKEFDYTIFGESPLIGSKLDKKYGWTEIRSKIVNFFAQGKPSQTLILFFSGHGIAKKNDVYLATPQIDPKIPQDQGIGLSSFLTQQMSDCKSRRIVTIIDSCHSGAAELPSSKLKNKGLKKKAADNAVTQATKTYDRLWKNVPKAPGKILMLSSQSYAVSWATKKNSIYTKHLIEGLKGTEDLLDDNGETRIRGSINKRNQITPESLHEYLYDTIADSIDQVPQLKGDRGSTIILNRKKISPKKQVEPIEPSLDSTKNFIYEVNEPHILKGLKILEKRNFIPKRMINEKINIASWNIREFGRKSRTKAAIHYIAKIISNFDLIAITNVQHSLDDVERVRKLLGPSWKKIFSEYTIDPAGNGRRIVILFDGKTIEHTGLVSESDPIRERDPKIGGYLPSLSWWHNPYMASFRSNDYEFSFLAVYPRWDSAESITKYIASRSENLEKLADWIDKRRKLSHGIEQDLFVIGDFGISSIGSRLFNSITKHGLQIPKGLVGLPSTNIGREKRYDQIMFYQNFPYPITGGIADFHQGSWRALFPKKHYSIMTQSKFTFEMSDHLPLWTQIDVKSYREKKIQLRSR